MHDGMLSSFSKSQKISSSRSTTSCGCGIFPSLGFLYSNKAASHHRLLAVLRLMFIAWGAGSRTKICSSSACCVGFGFFHSFDPSSVSAMVRKKKRSRAVSGSFQRTTKPRKGEQQASCAATEATVVVNNKKYYLLKSEPAEFSIENLRDKPDQTVTWDGVRSHEAKKVLLSMSYGDLCFFYHSSCKIPGIVGIVTVVSEKAEMDLTALDPQHSNYDPKYTDDNCPWVAVRVKLDRVLPSVITLHQLKEAAANNPSIAQMTLLRRPRLSVSELTEEQWNSVLELNDSRSDLA